MSFASDLQSVTRSDDAQMIEGRTRVQAIYFVSTSSAGSIRLYDGTDNSTDPEILLVSPADVGATDIMLPDAGVLFKNGVYMDLSNVTSVTLFFYGGAKVDVDTPVSVTGVQGTGAIGSVVVPNAGVAPNGVSGTGGVNGVTVPNAGTGPDGVEGIGGIGDVTVDTPA